ncbi:MAG: haloacid dehalogenase type II [Chloroflexota bacterium]
MPSEIDFTDVDALTFDCYGTLIDWEAGLSAAFRAVLDAHDVAHDPEDVLVRFGRHEAEAEGGPYRTYREVLAHGLGSVASELGFDPTDDEVERFSRSVEDWPAFPDSTEALRRLKRRFRLGVLTNCDDDLFAASNRRLAVDFDWVITAQQVGSYKPNKNNFEVMLDRLGLPQQRIVHVAQSLFHDHAPAKRLGFTTVWINRRHDRPGSGATPRADARPDATFPDMASFAAAAVPE